MTDNNEKKRDFRPTITAMFETKSGNYMSRKLDEDGLLEVQNAIAKVKLGDTLFLRKSKKPNAKGGNTWYLDVVDPETFTPQAPTSGSNDL